MVLSTGTIYLYLLPLFESGQKYNAKGMTDATQIEKTKTMKQI